MPITDPGNILVVDDHRQARESIAEVLRCSGHTVALCAGAREALKVLNKKNIDCIITDLKMPGMDGVEFIAELEKRQTNAQIVMVTAHASVDTAVEAMRHGAFDYIEKPFDAEKLENLVSRAIQHGRLSTNKPAATSSNNIATAPAMIGNSEAMQKLRKSIERIAPTDETVLISGESGTGKELISQTVHSLSRRAKGAWVSLNCPVLSAQLTESELFGHRKGAFTGAEADRVGRFQAADGGSILLDEISEVDLGLQAKLLRVLQERTFEPVGSSETIGVDVRVLATTNRDLLAEVEKGRFRQDLYYRLAVVPLVAPPLRERREDIPELIAHFLGRCSERLDFVPGGFTDSAMELLVGYNWPGNVRELENIVKRASVLGGEDTVGPDEIARWLLGENATTTTTTLNAAKPEPISKTVAANTPSESAPSETTPQVGPGLSLQEMEKQLIESTLNHYEGHRAKTAQALGIGVRTLSNKLKEFGYKPREKSMRSPKAA